MLILINNTDNDYCIARQNLRSDLFSIFAILEPDRLEKGLVVHVNSCPLLEPQAGKSPRTTLPWTTNECNQQSIQSEYSLQVQPMPYTIVLSSLVKSSEETVIEMSH